MKENKSEKLNFNKTVVRVGTAIAVGTGLIFGASALVAETRANNSSYLTVPPEIDQLDTKVRTFNDSYVQMSETLKWIPEIKRWQIVDRQIEAVPRKKSSIPFLDTIDNLYAIENLNRRKDFFDPPENPGCKTSNDWNRNNWTYTYCWDKNTNSWQQTSEGPLYNAVR